MEDVLHLYGLAYDEAFPVVCFDERPCVLHGEVVEPLEMRPGKPKRQDYEYELGGHVLLADRLRAALRLPHGRGLRAAHGW